MPVNYNYTENGYVYSFDEVFVPVDLFRQGSMWGWGQGTSGQLGNATISNSSTPVTTFTGQSSWKQVSVGYNQTAAIKTDGTLWIWGNPGSGKLGNATVSGTISTPITTFAGGTNWKQVSCAAGDFTAAIKTDGTLWTWGSGSNGTLGNGETTGSISTPITTFAGGTNWKELSCGYQQVAAIKTDGTLWMWGNTTNGQLGNGLTTGVISTPITTFTGGTNWKQVSCGYTFYTSAIKTDGTLWIWGNGSGNRLGNNASTNRSTPITTFAGGNSWKQVSLGAAQTLVIKTDGTLWGWGSNSLGVLAMSDAILVATPSTTFSGGTNWKQVSAGNQVSAAVKTDGTLWTWGLHNSGGLGNGETTGSISTPITTFAGGTNWKQVSSRYRGSAALTYIDTTL